MVHHHPVNLCNVGLRIIWWFVLYQELSRNHPGHPHKGNLSIYDSLRIIMKSQIPPPQKKMLADRIGRDTLNVILADFYEQAKFHPLLGASFEKVQDWSEHINRISHFWWAALGGSSDIRLRYDLTEKHFHAGFSSGLLIEWKKLFGSTLSKYLSEDIQYEWLKLIEIMGEKLLKQNARYQQN